MKLASGGLESDVETVEDWGLASIFPAKRLNGLSVVQTVSSIYIWSKNFSHSSMQKSEAKHGGNWRSYSTSVSGPCAKISLNGISIFPRRGLELTYYTHTIRLFTPSISAIFGFTFSNQVLTPDIYGAHWVQTAVKSRMFLALWNHKQNKQLEILDGHVCSANCQGPNVDRNCCLKSIQPIKVDVPSDIQTGQAEKLLSRCS